MRKITLIGLSLLFTLFSTLAQAQQYIYVCNQGSASVTVINAETLEISDTVDLRELGYSENAKPHFAIAEPDGSYWYVTLIGENRVLKFNRNNELIGSAEMEVPGLMALHPGNNELYVGRSMSAVNPPQSFVIVDRSSMSPVKEVDLFFGRPHALAAHHAKNYVYVGSLSSNQFLSMNTVSEDMELLNLDGSNHVLVNFAVSPDGKTLVATGQVTGKLLIFDISDPLNPKLRTSLDVEAMPWHPIFSPKGDYVYFANKEANAVTIVNMNTEKVEDVIKGEGLAQPHGAALSQDGKYLFISNNNMIMKGMDHGNMNHSNHSEPKNGSVVVIDTQKRAIIKVIEVGMNATGIGTNAR